MAAIATGYTTFPLYAAGLEVLLLSCIVYAPGTILFVLTRRGARSTLFSPWEAILFAAVALGAVAGIVGPTTGAITI